MKRTLLAVPLCNQKGSGENWAVTDLHSGNLTEVEGKLPEASVLAAAGREFRDSLERYLRDEYLLQ